jgi:hypothetical protein
MYTIEAERNYSTHVGMVFGRYVNDADRKPRVSRWLVLSDGRVVAWFRTRREAAAYVASRQAGEGC